MARRMFFSARALMRAGMPAASGTQLRRRLFLRLNAWDLPDERFRERAALAVEEWRPQ